MPVVFDLQRSANLLTDAANIPEIEVSIRLAGGPDADKRSGRRQNRFRRVVGRTETPARYHSRDDLADIRLYNRRLPTVDQVYFGPNRINANHFVSLVGKTSCGNRTNIT